MPVSVPAIGVRAPGLRLCVRTAGAGQGHDHAHEDCHHSPSHPPSICSPINDLSLSLTTPCLLMDGCIAAVSTTNTPSQNAGHSNVFLINFIFHLARKHEDGGVAWCAGMVGRVVTHLVDIPEGGGLAWYRSPL